ncbi:DNA polymerase IV [Parvularcula bermudensis]|uniref:DNA polymerase IV n=1 Tax=Parvularcula bermudensis TaxID=208216 RepID=UPI0002F0FBA1|nr:DNA polymerase IV [Parvularcula bermudensis]
MESTATNSKGVCLDCGGVSEPVSPLCPICGSARQVSHPELDRLSIAHVDCDAFFAAIEKRDDPSLVDKPVLVGGGHRGVVSTCCYIARSYGIHSAMPMFKAKALCPQAVIVPPRGAAYREAAAQIRDLMAPLTPLIQPVSIDEAYLDLGGTERLHGAIPAQLLAKLAKDVETQIGITLSIGLSVNKLLAKIASDFDKPRGFTLIGGTEAANFLAPYPPGLLPGIGTRFSEKLMRDGFRTLGDLQHCSTRELVDRYGEHGLTLRARACGEDPRPVTVDRETKSVSGETTFRADIGDAAALEDHLYAMARKVSSRAKEKGLAGRVVTLKLKTARFRTFTRRQTLPHASNLTRVIFDCARAMLTAELQKGRTPVTYRLIGAGISDLVPAEVMHDGYLFAEDLEKTGRREDAIDKLNARFGEDSIGTMRDRRIARK